MSSFPVCFCIILRSLLKGRNYLFSILLVCTTLFKQGEIFSHLKEKFSFDTELSYSILFLISNFLERVTHTCFSTFLFNLWHSSLSLITPLRLSLLLRILVLNAVGSSHSFIVFDSSTQKDHFF